MNEAQYLSHIARRQNKAKPYKTTTIGRLVNNLLQYNITPKYKNAECLTAAWNKLLPHELQQHCRIADLTAGHIKIAVDSAPHRYELQLAGADLLEELQKQCPTARIKTIKFIPGSLNHSDTTRNNTQPGRRQRKYERP